MAHRPYDPAQDESAVLRIWNEVGWVDPERDAETDAFRAIVSAGRGLVSEINGAAECFVSTAPGSMQHTRTLVPMVLVAAVTTSHIARRQGLAQELTTQSVVQEAADGTVLATLGIFDQGFYDKLGFGNGSYEHMIAFDPSDLRVGVAARPPMRLTVDDWERVHASRMARMLHHGSVSITPPEFTKAEMLWTRNGFGFGYVDDADGRLTHHVWLSAKGMERGPVKVWWMAYETWDQFLELMALMSNLGDQVYVISMREPNGVQLQDLISQPFRRQRISVRSDHETSSRAFAYTQTRICDVPPAVAAATMPGEVRFQLDLRDPIADHVADDAVWRGVGGSYVVSFGKDSAAEPGTDSSLPVLNASVGAFTRLWLGTLPASGLAVTDELNAPPGLIEALDDVVRLPVPRSDWDY